MDVNGVMQLIGSLGFPIVACGALFWMLNRQNEMHAQESKEMKEAIQELRAAIIQLTASLTAGKIDTTKIEY